MEYCGSFVCAGYAVLGLFRIINVLKCTIGGCRGAPGVHPPKGPNSFILTYKFYEM